MGRRSAGAGMWDEAGATFAPELRAWPRLAPHQKRTRQSPLCQGGRIEYVCNGGILLHTMYVFIFICMYVLYIHMKLNHSAINFFIIFCIVSYGNLQTLY